MQTGHDLFSLLSLCFFGNGAGVEIFGPVLQDKQARFNLFNAGCTNRRHEPNAKAQRQQQQQQHQQQQQAQLSSVQSGRPSLLTHKRRQQSFPITLLRCCCCCCSKRRRTFIILQLRKITGILYYLYMNIKFEKNATLQKLMKNCFL
ncbi:hypothetical protein T11_4778 [Trichinella zimbabwensis]|uniref:Uncharacterized protein n=1 Tax=Trichinella zimbabwensis TaxID=268475 RepID=A0A0V1I3Y6_9BILA|nr:hypothetical protein T11_4778 [Trichinella zimbabwensis]